MNVIATNETGLPGKSGPYRQLWRIVEGAVNDAFKNHPDYLTPKGRRNARSSIVKRVTGTVLSFAVEAARGLRKRADKDSGVHEPGPASPSYASGAAAGALLRQPQNFDLAMMIATRGAKRRCADEREYRHNVAAKAAALDRYVRDEARKQRINAYRASGRGRAASDA